MLLTLMTINVQATDYFIEVSSDDLIDNGNCTLREALTAATTFMATDQCPAGSETSSNSITLSSNISTYDFNQGQFVVPDIDMPVLTIKGEDTEQKPVISLGLNNRFLRIDSTTQKQFYISNLVFFFGRDNNGEGGGVIRATGGNNLQLTDVTFLNSQSNSRGGALYFDSQDAGLFRLQLQRTTWQGNQGTLGGAVYVRADATQENRSSFEVIASEFVNNTSTTGHGAFYADLIDDNSPRVNDAFLFDQVLFEGNQATGDVAGLYLQSDTRSVVLQQVHFHRNSGAGAYLKVYTDSFNNTPDIIIKGAQFIDNYTATAVGQNQLYIEEPDDARTASGIYQLSDVLLLHTTAFRRGQAISFQTKSQSPSLNRLTVINHEVGIAVNNSSSGTGRINGSILYNNSDHALGDISLADHNLIDTDPLLEPQNGHDHVPASNSPALDAGAASPGTIDLQALTDANFRPRMVGTHVDIGAMERQAEHNLTLFVHGGGQVQVGNIGPGPFSCDSASSPCVYSQDSDQSFGSIRAVFNAPDIFQGWVDTDCADIIHNSCQIGYLLADREVHAHFLDEFIFINGFE